MTIDGEDPGRGFLTHLECTSCGATFQARGPWMRKCWTCWRAEQDAHTRTSAYRDGYRDGFAAGRARTHRALPPNLISDTIALCHPDRHPVERQELATRVTRTLLDLRGAA